MFAKFINRSTWAPDVKAMLAALALTMGAPLAAAQAPPARELPPVAARLEGGWFRTDPEGSGSFGGINARIPPAVLTPEALAAIKAAAAPQVPAGRSFRETRTAPLAAGEAFIAVDRPCQGGGGGGAGIIPDSSAIHIVPQRDEVLWVREGLGGRHIYMDGRKHPDPSRWTPTNYGHSIGRWENDALVVETTGLTAGAVAGGGRRSPETILTERMTPSADGKTLTIQYTWTDPKIYLKPHTWTYTLEHIAAGSNAGEWWCDASDPREQQSIVPPVQR